MRRFLSSVIVLLASCSTPALASDCSLTSGGTISCSTFSLSTADDAYELWLPKSFQYAQSYYDSHKSLVDTFAVGFTSPPTLISLSYLYLPIRLPFVDSLNTSSLENMFKIANSAYLITETYVYAYFSYFTSVTATAINIYADMTDVGVSVAYKVGQREPEVFAGEWVDYTIVRTGQIASFKVGQISLATPGPIAAAGLPSLLGLAGFLAWRRRTA